MTQTVANTARKAGRPPIADPDYNAARARKMEADAEMAELELLKAKRELVASDDVLAAWTDVMGAMKAKLLALPTICAPICATETEIQIIQSVLEDQINEALNELSAYKPAEHAGRTASGSGNSDANAETAAAPKRKRVGRPRKAVIVGG